MKRGYTVIELAISLAIAGLVVSMVFLAINQANRDQRDDARKADVGRYLAAVGQWTADNNGVPPGSNPPSAQTEAIAVVTTYITPGSSKFADPKTGDWIPLYVSSNCNVPCAPSSMGTMYVKNQATCSGGSISTPGGTREFAVAVQLEGGNYCASK